MLMGIAIHTKPVSGYTMQMPYPINFESVNMLALS